MGMYEVQVSDLLWDVCESLLRAYDSTMKEGNRLVVDLRYLFCRNSC